jgi:hypothetical protein
MNCKSCYLSWVRCDDLTARDCTNSGCSPALFGTHLPYIIALPTIEEMLAVIDVIIQKILLHASNAMAPMLLPQFPCRLLAPVALLIATHIALQILMLAYFAFLTSS